MCKAKSPIPCFECGEEFTPKIATSKYCSKPCAVKVKKRNELGKIGKATCVTCGSEFQPKSQADPKQGRFNKYCSTKCRTAHPDWKNVKRQKAAQYLTKKPFSNVFFPDCKVCGKLFTASLSKTMLCSTPCRAEWGRIKAYQNDSKGFVSENFNCQECGKAFATKYGVKRRMFCSEKCSSRNVKRAGRHARRARLKQVEVERISPIIIFTRDKWTCRICGIKTPKKLQGLSVDNAPSLDHIIPVAKGGSHTYANLQCACRRCNSYKCDKIIGQLPLLLTIAA